MTNTEEQFTEEEIQDNPQLQAAIKNAQAGQYEHTMFEMWEQQLQTSIFATQGLLTIPVADSIMRQYPWLGYAGIALYLERRRELLEEALAALEKCYPKDKETLFTENVDDWKLHQDGYLDVTFEWTVLTNQWARRWTELDFESPDKAVMHAVIADVTGMIAGPDGFMSQIQHLAHFYVSDEAGEELGKRVSEALNDE